MFNNYGNTKSQKLGHYEAVANWDNDSLKIAEFRSIAKG